MNALVSYQRKIKKKKEKNCPPKDKKKHGPTENHMLLEEK